LTGDIYISYAASLNEMLCPQVWTHLHGTPLSVSLVFVTRYGFTGEKHSICSRIILHPKNACISARKKFFFYNQPAGKRNNLPKLQKYKSFVTFSYIEFLSQSEMSYIAIENPMLFSTSELDGTYTSAVPLLLCNFVVTTY
jgi:hypothetical protein